MHASSLQRVANGPVDIEEALKEGLYHEELDRFVDEKVAAAMLGCSLSSLQKDRENPKASWHGTSVRYWVRRVWKYMLENPPKSTRRGKRSADVSGPDRKTSVASQKSKS